MSDGRRLHSGARLNWRIIAAGIGVPLLWIVYLTTIAKRDFGSPLPPRLLVFLALNCIAIPVSTSYRTGTGFACFLAGVAIACATAALCLFLYLLPFTLMAVLYALAANGNVAIMLARVTVMGLTLWSAKELLVHGMELTVDKLKYIAPRSRNAAKIKVMIGTMGFLFATVMIGSAGMGYRYLAGLSS